MSEDPIRLLDDDDASSALRADLRVAGSDASEGYDVDAGLQRFALLVASGATATVASAAAAKGAAASGAAATGGLAFGLKIIGIAVVVLGAVGASVMFGGNNAPAKAAPESSAVIAPARTETKTDTTSTPEVVGESPPSEPPHVATPSSSRDTSLPVHVAPPPSATAVTDSSAVNPGVASGGGSGLRSDGNEGSESDSVALEISNQKSLRAILHSDPARALALADEGQARFPKGIFGQEREFIAIQALAALGRQGDARARGAAFLTRHPESPYAEALKRIVGSAAP